MGQDDADDRDLHFWRFDGYGRHDRDRVCGFGRFSPSVARIEPDYRLQPTFDLFPSMERWCLVRRLIGV